MENAIKSEIQSTSNPFVEGEQKFSIEPDGDDDIPSEMTASYSEISFHGISGQSSSSNTNVTSRTSETPENKIPQRPVSLGYGKRKASFPYNLEGTVSVDGNMTNFVAENLEYKIKLASPVMKLDSSLPNSRTSTPSTSVLLSRQFLNQSQHNHPQQIDVNVLNDVEIEAQYLATSVDNLTENLCNLLHSISSITADNVETYKNSVNKLTDCMDGNIKSMYTIMAKTEEISNAMKPTESLAIRIREIKRLVDMLESNL